MFGTAQRLRPHRKACLWCHASHMWWCCPLRPQVSPLDTKSVLVASALQAPDCFMGCCVSGVSHDWLAVGAVVPATTAAPNWHCWLVLHHPAHLLSKVTRPCSRSDCSNMSTKHRTATNTLSAGSYRMRLSQLMHEGCMYACSFG